MQTRIVIFTARQRGERTVAGQTLVTYACRKQPGKLKVVQLDRNSLVPRLSLCANEKFRTKSWAGLGNEARIVYIGGRMM